MFNHINGNLYHYAGNNPVRYVDPDGREAKEYIKYTVHTLGANPFSVWLAQKGIFPNETFGFSFDANTGVYHTTFDCWQGGFGGNIGYNDGYDVIFDLATNMESKRFDFSSGGKDYTLWAWKGDYLNLGAGCELGIYEKADGRPGTLGHFKVNKELAMDTQASLSLNGKVIGSFSGRHWWATIFKPSVQRANPNDLTAEFSVNFGNNRQMYYDFKNKWENDQKWSFNDESNTAKLEF